MSPLTIAVLGAGNGGCAAAADLTLRGHEVRLYSRSQSTLAPILERGGITLREEGKTRLARPSAVSNDLGSSVSGADWIVITAPAVAHGDFAAALAESLVDGQRVLLNPGHTGGSFHFAHTLRSAGCRKRIALCETVTLTYICRMPQPATVEIYRRTSRLGCAAFPAEGGAESLRAVQDLFPNVIAAENVLETGFSNINAIIHPAGMLGNAGWIEHTGGDFLYYREGISPSIAAWIERVDRERLAITERLGIPGRPFVEIFFQAGLTSADARASGSAFRAIRESEPNRSIRAPSSLQHRYLHEDVGYGLVPMAEIGRRVGVATPVIDALIALAGAAVGVDYGQAGLTLEKMGLAGVEPGELVRIARYGFGDQGG